MNRLATVTRQPCALPQTVSQSEIVVDLQQGGDSCPNDADLAINPHPWLEAIVRLWDDAQLARSIEELAYQNARDYASSKTAERIVDFLSQFDKTN